MSENNDLTSTNGLPGEEFNPVFITHEELNKKNENIDYSNVYESPTIKTRYFSTLIDLLVILLFSFGVSALFEEIGQVPDYTRGIFLVLVVFLYEPTLVSVGSTFGQFVLNIRVRSFKNPEKKLAFPLVFIRFMIKFFLGWLSFITVTFNINRRAIHDFASGSIVIANKIKK